MMTLEEINSRLKTIQLDETQLYNLHQLYVILNLEIDDFAKIIDAVGVEKLLEQSGRYEMLCDAENELKRKEIYLEAKVKLAYIDKEREELKGVIQHFESTLEV